MYVNIEIVDVGGDYLLHIIGMRRLRLRACKNNILVRVSVVTLQWQINRFDYSELCQSICLSQKSRRCKILWIVFGWNIVTALPMKQQES